MKILVLTFILALIGLTSCQSITAQPTPVISDKYSNEEIEKMIELFKTAPHKNIRPSENLHIEFNKDFPNAKDIEWEIGASIHEVEFEIGHTDYKAYYDSNASLIRYDLELRESELPAIIKNAALFKYPDYDFDNIEKTVMGTNTFYKVEIKRSEKRDVKAIFNSDGVFVGEVVD